MTYGYKLVSCDDCGRVYKTDTSCSGDKCPICGKGRQGEVRAEPEQDQIIIVVFAAMPFSPGIDAETHTMTTTLNYTRYIFRGAVADVWILEASGMPWRVARSHILKWAPAPATSNLTAS